MKIKRIKDKFVSVSKGGTITINITPTSFSVDKTDLKSPGKVIIKTSSGELKEFDIDSTTGIGIFGSPKDEIIVLPITKNANKKKVKTSK